MCFSKTQLVSHCYIAVLYECIYQYPSFIHTKTQPYSFPILGYIFNSGFDHWVHSGIFEYGVLLMYTLEGVSSVAIIITAYKESQ